MIEKRMDKGAKYSFILYTMRSALVADLLGHADTRMVETTYARTRHEGVMKQRQAVGNLNAFLYFKLQNGDSVFLCVIIDLFSRMVVGYRVSRRASTQLVTYTFRKAFEERACPRGLVFHSDRGAQYISNAFEKLLNDRGVLQSFSASGSPYDNAVAETFFATFKKEEAYRRDYTSVRDFIRHVDEYIIFYNELRPHKTLAYQILQRYEERYYEKTEKIPK